MACQLLPANVEYDICALCRGSVLVVAVMQGSPDGGMLTSGATCLVGFRFQLSRRFCSGFNSLVPINPVLHQKCQEGADEDKYPHGLDLTPKHCAFRMPKQ